VIDRERAQSSAIGFVFVFSIIVVTVGVVTAVGLPVLEDARETERIDNMERAFEVLADNVEDVSRSSAPSRATEVKLTGGSLALGPSSNVTVEAYDENDPDQNMSTYNARPRPIAYQDGGTEIAYVAGSVIRTDAGSTALSGPGWIVSEERTVLPMVVTRAGGDSTSLGGELTALVLAEELGRDVTRSYAADNDTVVEVTVRSPRADAWGRYMAGAGFDCAGPADPPDGVTCRIETAELVIPEIRVGVSMSR